MTTTIVELGLVCWIATAILADSELCRPLRDWLDRRAHLATEWLRVHKNTPLLYRRDVVADVFFRKARYLAACHLCAGTWIALALTAIVPVPAFGSGFVGWLLAGLLVKAVAHLTLIVQRTAEAITR